ncbi:MAG: PAS domain-containing protein, partial [Paracoccaceae bacterium]
MINADALWMSLPVPALLLSGDDIIDALNPAAEGFFNASSKVLKGSSVWDRLKVDTPLEEAVQRARAQAAPLFVNDVDVGTQDRAPLQCNLQIAPMMDRPGCMIMMIAPRELAGRMT